MGLTCTGGDREICMALSGEADHHHARGLMTEIEREIDRELPKHVTLDLGGVTFMDSSGIGLVMGRYKICESMGASLEIHGLSRHAYKVMCLAGLQNLAVLKKKKEAEKSETA